MGQNRDKLIGLFIGNLSNAILHKILANAIKDKEIIQRYDKEIKTSWEISKEYRAKINPAHDTLPPKDIKDIQRRITSKVRAELSIRISKGYENLDLNLVERSVDKALKEMKVV